MVRCKPLAQITKTIPIQRGADFALNADSPDFDMVIGNGFFLRVFLEDAHDPRMAPGWVCGQVKKVVMKVQVG